MVNKFFGTRIYNVFQESPLTLLLPAGFYFLGILITLLFQRIREKCKNFGQHSDLGNLIRKNIVQKHLFEIVLGALMAIKHFFIIIRLNNH